MTGGRDSCLLLALLTTLAVSQITAFHHQPALLSGWDWYPEPIQRRLERLVDSAFSDSFDFNFRPRSYISSYHTPSCSRPATQPDYEQAKSEYCQQNRPMSAEEQHRQSTLTQLKEERLRQDRVREEHERLERETDEKIHTLEAESAQAREEQEMQQRREENRKEQQRRDEEVKRLRENEERVREQQEWLEEKRMLRQQRNKHEEQERLRKERQRQEEESLRREEMVREARKQEETRQRFRQKQRDQQLHEKRAAHGSFNTQSQRVSPQTTQRASRSTTSSTDNQRYAQRLVEHMAPGYYPEDLAILVKDGRILISGSHICSCTEDCITKEFSRSYALPSHIDPHSVRASMDTKGKMTLTGSRRIRGQVNPTSAISVAVTGEGDFRRPTAEELRACLGGKGGIKLNRVSKKTGRVVEEREHEWESDTEPLSERPTPGDDEFSTIEVEY